MKIECKTVNIFENICPIKYLFSIFKMKSLVFNFGDNIFILNEIYLR